MVVMTLRMDENTYHVRRLANDCLGRCKGSQNAILGIKTKYYLSLNSELEK